VIAQGYGMTETTLAIPIPDRDAGTPPGAAGRLAPGTRLRVVDPDTGADRPAGATGELWVRGPQVTTGYRGDEVATRGLFAPGGWLRTGDLGLIARDGQVRVVDRLKELIKSTPARSPRPSWRRCCSAATTWRTRWSSRARTRGPGRCRWPWSSRAARWTRRPCGPGSPSASRRTSGWPR